VPFLGHPVCQTTRKSWEIRCWTQRSTISFREETSRKLGGRKFATDKRNFKTVWRLAILAHRVRHRGCTCSCINLKWLITVSPLTHWPFRTTGRIGVSSALRALIYTNLNISDSVEHYGIDVYGRLSISNFSEDFTTRIAAAAAAGDGGGGAVTSPAAAAVDGRTSCCVTASSTLISCRPGEVRSSSAATRPMHRARLAACSRLLCSALSNAVTGLLAGRNWITPGTDVGVQQIRFHRCALSKPVCERRP